MGTKVIHFIVAGRKETAEFPLDAPAEEVKDCFRCAAEAGPYDILKLYNHNGNLVNISPNLIPNDINCRYKLEVVAAHCGHCGKDSSGRNNGWLSPWRRENVSPPRMYCFTGKGYYLKALAPGKDLHGLDVEKVDGRLHKLEKRVFVDEGCFPPELLTLKQRVETFKVKLEKVEHLSWLGLFKDMNIGPSALPYTATDDNRLKRADKEYHTVLDSFLQMGSSLTSEEILTKLRTPSFDNWQWEDAEMMFLVQQMFVDLGLIETFHIEIPVLQQFIFEVYKHYNLVPFHNFRHSFCVTQMMYGMICLSGLNGMIAPHEVLIMLVAAFCHDLDHPGYNNAYQVNARTELAIRYNDISPLENHHAAVAFDILSQPRCNIFGNIKAELYVKIRKGIIMLILATDMARHNELLSEFKLLGDNFDWLSQDHRFSMMKMFIKAADVSNETRPMDVAEPWLDCLLQEFFRQSDAEKLEGLPTASHMDREKVTKSSAQIGFIKFVLIPLYEALSELFPVFESFLLTPIQSAFEYYVEMGRKMEEEKLEKQMKENKKYTLDYERKLDIEISRKLSREFDIRLTAEIQKKFTEDRERKLSGDFRQMTNSGNNSRKSSTGRKISDYSSSQQFNSTSTSNSPSPSQADKTEENTTEDINDVKHNQPNPNTVYIHINDKKIYPLKRPSLDERPHLNGAVPLDNTG